MGLMCMLQWNLHRLSLANAAALCLLVLLAKSRASMNGAILEQEKKQVALTS